MTKFIHYINKDFEQQFETDINRFYHEVRSQLPSLPENIKIYFMSESIAYGMHAGGYAYSPDIISIAVDPRATDLAELRDEIRSTIFHEAYHVAHNYTGATGPFRLLENAIQEGSATVFEQNYTDSKSRELYGNYRQHTEAELGEWLDIIRKLPISQAMNSEEYATIAFYDESDNTRWKLYKTGAWLVEEYLAKNNMDIVNFTNEDIKKLISSLK